MRREPTLSGDRPEPADLRRDARSAVMAIANLAGRLADVSATAAERAHAASAVRKHCRRLLQILGEAETPAEAGGAPPTPPRRVLVAEDCPDSRQAVCSFLSHAGWEVTPAENGRVAVALSRTARFDLVLLDMQMPEVDGYEAARLLRRDGYRGPVIALTGDVQPGDEQACHDAGCTAYLAKPWEPKQLLKVLEQQLNPAPDVTKQPRATSSPRSDPTLRQLAREFARTLPRAVSEISAAVEARDRRLTARLAHKVAGAAGLFGYADVCREARALEVAAHENAVADEVLGERVRSLGELIQRIVRGLGEPTA